MGVTVPKDESHGDFSCNLAMILAANTKTKPRVIAEKLSRQLAGNGLFSSVSVAGPGFINMTVHPDHWAAALDQIFTAGEDFGRISVGHGEKVMVEFVSANPTGPLHIGHGRGAVVGDTLARILSWAGYDVHSEYYINDVGLQMDNLGQSTLARCRELLGQPAGELPYKGDYIIDIARQFLEANGERIMEAPLEESLAKARKFSADKILDGIRSDLEEFRVGFDEWFSEATLHDSGEVEKTINQLQRKGHIREEDGALWLKTGSAGDEKDRVVRRANGVTTYLAADLAYHKSKIDRKYSMLVNVWGADHHGYVPRMKAAVSALGHDPEKLIVRLVQLVSLKRGGQTVAMSTREGVFTTLREILDEVGVDATRYFFLMRSSDSQLEFDVELAKRHSSDNPVYYIQYAHARCCNIFVTAKETGVKRIPFDQVDKSLLTGGDELRLIRKLLMLPDVVDACARSCQPHPVTGYLTEVAAFFHYFYKHNRVVTDDEPLTHARLALVEATMMVIRNGLEILGIDAPRKM